MLLTLLLTTAPMLCQERVKQVEPEDGIQTPSPYSLIPDSDGVTTRALPGEIWVDDDIPGDATAHAEGGDGWNWVKTNPAPVSGVRAHQTPVFGPFNPSNPIHRHYFDGTIFHELFVDFGDTLFTYVFLDPNNMPNEIMLEFRDPFNFNHRAYWGQNNIKLGTDGTDSRRYMGPLPKASTWVRLEVPAKFVGMENNGANGMSFVIDTGRATFDAAGVIAASEIIPSRISSDVVWIEDGLPAGAKTATVNDVWKWVENLSPFGLAHQSFVSVSHNTTVYRSHSFTGATTALNVDPGDVLFTYVWMDPNAMPDEIMLQWYDGQSWEHRAFWGENYIGKNVPNIGVQGTESQRFAGGLPPGGVWYRLEVPASYVGLENKSVTGMAFSLYGKEPTVIWDRSGKAPQMSTTPVPLTSTVGIWQLKHSAGYYAYDANDQGPDDYLPQKKDAFLAYPNQVPGSVPFYRFRRPNASTPELFYSRSLAYDGNGWKLDGTAFFVYPDAGTSGTVPLYLYHDAQSHYFLTINQSDATNMILDGIAAYVLPPKAALPAAPGSLNVSFRADALDWRDNSTNESGFQIERFMDSWVVVGNVGANITHYDTSSNVPPCTHVEYRVRALNELGYSDTAQGEYGCAYIGRRPESHSPEVSIAEPRNNDQLSGRFAIVAEPSDPEGPGTIAKVEFFANGNKLGEVSGAPYVLPWNDALPGTYQLTTTVTDAAGLSATSPPITITVSEPVISPTRPTIRELKPSRPKLRMRATGRPESTNQRL